MVEVQECGMVGSNPQRITPMVMHKSILVNHHCGQVKSIHSIGEHFPPSLVSSKQHCMVVICFGEGEATTWRRPCPTNSRGGPCP